MSFPVVDGPPIVAVCVQGPSPVPPGRPIAEAISGSCATQPLCRAPSIISPVEAQSDARSHREGQIVAPRVQCGIIPEAGEVQKKCEERRGRNQRRVRPLKTTKSADWGERAATPSREPRARNGVAQPMPNARKFERSVDIRSRAAKLSFRSGGLIPSEAFGSKARQRDGQNDDHGDHRAGDQPTHENLPFIATEWRFSCLQQSRGRRESSREGVLVKP